MDFSETLERVRQTADIVDVVGSVLKLKRRGQNYKALCPFHDEKTPSFTVTPSKGIYKCFGCGKGGDAIEFIKEHENYSFYEAVSHLAARYDIPVYVQGADDEQATAARGLYATNKHFANVFEFDKRGKDYLLSKDFTEETIKTFRIGYCDDKPLDQKYRKYKLLKEQGLVKASGRNFFENRVIFPICNVTGSVISFAGRVTDDSKPKYVNGIETSIYKKSNTLYGLHIARKAIHDKEEVFNVEGYTDVMMMHQVGIKNVVSCSGTSFTKDQLMILKRMTDRVITIFDGDNAGRKAMRRAVDIYAKCHMSPLFIEMPEGEDPKTYFQKDNTYPTSFDWIIKEAKTIAELEVSMRAKPYKELSEIINTYDSVLKQMYTTAVAEILGLEVKSYAKPIFKKPRVSTKKYSPNVKMAYLLALFKDHLPENEVNFNIFDPSIKKLTQEGSLLDLPESISSQLPEILRGQIIDIDVEELLDLEELDDKINEIAITYQYT